MESTTTGEMQVVDRRDAASHMKSWYDTNETFVRYPPTTNDQQQGLGPGRWLARFRMPFEGNVELLGLAEESDMFRDPQPENAFATLLSDIHLDVQLGPSFSRRRYPSRPLDLSTRKGISLNSQCPGWSWEQMSTAIDILLSEENMARFGMTDGERDAAEQLQDGYGVSNN